MFLHEFNQNSSHKMKHACHLIYYTSFALCETKKLQLTVDFQFNSRLDSMSKICVTANISIPLYVSTCKQVLVNLNLWSFQKMVSFITKLWLLLFQNVYIVISIQSYLHSLYSSVKGRL